MKAKLVGDKWDGIEYDFPRLPPTVCIPVRVGTGREEYYYNIREEVPEGITYYDFARKEVSS